MGSVHWSWHTAITDLPTLGLFKAWTKGGEVGGGNPWNECITGNLGLHLRNTEPEGRQRGALQAANT